ncbi:MAG: HepT-like ribonuclease domain-containing protein [Bacillota bacterium]
MSSDEYLLNEDMQAIVERRLQLAIQACMDISNYIIAHQRHPHSIATGPG